MKRHLQSGGQRGFTLLELIVALSIGALLMALVATSLSSSASKVEMRSAARRMATALRYTRSQAIVLREEQVFEITVDPEGSSYRVPGKERDYELPKAIGVTLTTAEMELTGDQSGGIRFYPDGSSTGGSITLTTEDFEQTLDVVWLTGEVTLNEGDDQR